MASITSPIPAARSAASFRNAIPDFRRAQLVPGTDCAFDAQVVLHRLRLSDAAQVVPGTDCASEPRDATWNNYRAMLVRSCSRRLVLKGMRRSCEVPATSSAAIVSL